MMSLDRFHPAVRSWFERQFEAPTEAQRRGWPAIHERSHTLIAAPTGFGKTLAAFLAAIDTLVRQGLSGPLPDESEKKWQARRLLEYLEGAPAENPGL